MWPPNTWTTEDTLHNISKHAHTCFSNYSSPHHAIFVLVIKVKNRKITEVNPELNPEEKGTQKTKPKQRH